MQSINNNLDPIVSIVILSLFRQPDTLKCLQSIFLHTKGSYEIIVVDMGGSRAIVSWLKRISTKHDNISVVFNKKNVGIAKGRNQGIAVAKGKYIVFLDNDARVTRGWLDPLINAVKKSKTIGACGAKILLPNNDVQYCPVHIAHSKKNGILKTIGVDRRMIVKNNSISANRPGEVFWYPTTCLLVKKSALSKIGGFDENLHRAEEDKDLCLSLSKKGYTITYSPCARVYHDHAITNSSYDKMRYSMRLALRDINYFEHKWGCKSVNTISAKYLRKMGCSEKQIVNIAKFDFFTQLTDL